MDAYTHTVEPGRSKAGAPLRILYADADAASVARARDLGFGHVLIPPPWPGERRHGHFCARVFDLAASTVAKQARNAGLELLVDIQLDRLSAASPLAAAAGSPFTIPGREALLDPRRGVEAEIASARVEGLGDALALAAWWTPHLQTFGTQGVAGFRLLGLDAFPDLLAGAVFGALRRALPNALLLVWTPGMRRAAIHSLRGQGADGVFASLPWWDFTSEWLWDEIVDLLAVAPVIGADGIPGAADPADAARRAPFAATIGQGFLHTTGDDNDGAVQTLNALLRDSAYFASRTPPPPARRRRPHLGVLAPGWFRPSRLCPRRPHLVQ